MLRRGLVVAVVMVAGLVVALGGAARLEGQLAWDAPMLIGPAAPAGLGIFLMEPWPGNNIAVLGTYRIAPVPVGLGFRAGLGEGPRDRLALFGGVDVSGFLLRASDDLPLDVLWFTGAGLGVGDHLLLSFPLGLSVGANLNADGVTFGPYAAPRVVLDACIGQDREPPPQACRANENLDLDLAVDVGLDLAFDPRWMIRFAASLGDRRALLIGISFPY